MPSALIDPLFERLLQAYPADQTYDTDDWTDGPVPDSLRRFLEQVLKHRGRLEVHRLRRARTEWVAYEAPEVEAAARELETAVHAHVRIPADEWEDVLHQAARVVTRYLVHPVPTLTAFIFDDGDTSLPLNQVRWRMQFFGPYEYLHEAIGTYAERRSLSRIHPDTFRSFLARIDARAVSEGNADQHLRLLDPLFTIARVATGTKEVPTRLLRRFFEEKRASRLARRLEEHEQAGHPKMNPDALRRLIEATDEISDEAVPEIAPPLDVSVDESSSSTSASDPAPASPASEPADEKASRAEVDREAENASEADGEEVEEVALGEAEAPAFSDREPLIDSAEPSDEDPSSGPTSSDETVEDEPVEETSSPAETTSADASAEGAPSEAESEDESEVTPRWRQFQTVGPSRAESSEASESEEQTPLWARFKPFRASSKDSRFDGSSEGDASSQSGSFGETTRELERHIFGTSPAPHRDAYVRHLFEGSADDYRQVLTRIQRANSWNEASQIIAKDVFRANQVNIYSDVAVNFTDAVEAHFRT